MPPRRSTRTVRASAELTSSKKEPATKRKRLEAPEPEQENVKPAPRTRRSTASVASTASSSTKRAVANSTRPSRTSTRRKKIKEESDDEDHMDRVPDDDERPAKGRKISPPSDIEEENAETPRAQELDTAQADDLLKAGVAVKEAPEVQEIIDTSDVEEAREVLSAVIVDDEEENEETKEDTLQPPRSPTPRPAAPEEPQGPKTRLVIHKMALINFKSYAGRQEIGPFHKSFSAIVGPNGSGKSNTIDALLFVFGYRASKMRQGKLSELIHNSARYPDLESCSVEIHFRDIIDMPGPDAFELVPESQLVVARTAYKNNASKYTINGRQSSYTEVQTLLKGRGIDLDHNRFLILQGEVESIAQMKPKAPSEHEDGLLEYLEDIIGTSKYKEPIDEALIEMERLSEDRSEKLNRLRIVERERNALETKKKEAEDYLRLNNDHVRALSRLWQWYLWQCLINAEAYEKKITRLEKDLEEETERNRDDILNVEALAKEYEEKGKASEKVKAVAAEAIKSLAAQEKQQVGLEERRKHAKSKAKKLKKSLQDDEHARSEALRSIEDNSAKIERERAKVDDLEESLAKEENVLEEIRDNKTQVFHDQIEVKQKELQPWTAKINAKKAEVDLATSERDALAKKAEAAKAASKEAQELLEKLQTDLELKTTELEDLKTTKASNAREIRDQETRMQEMQARVQQLRLIASSARQKADEAKASQAANTSQNKVLDSLTRLKSTGRINGFHGRLGSLGTIPDKYDVAVSTACGALNNLVVDTVEQGQACIEYLRKQNVGRASFMVLEKLPNRGMDKISTPENVPRLFDLIKPKDPRFASAFFKGVANTLVANDLDQANRIAFGGQRRWRVVTLAGQLIDSSGTMSGGGTHVARGGMSSKLAADAIPPEVLRKYEEDNEAASRQLEEVSRHLREVEGELDAVSKSAPQLDIAIEKVSLDIKTCSKRIAEAERRARDLKSKIKPDAGDMARVATLEEEIASSTEELEELKEKTDSIEKEIKALEKKILEIGGARLLTQKSKVDGIRLHINLANDEITKAEVTKAKAEKDSAKLENTVQSNGAVLEEMEVELGELNEQIELINESVEELRSEVENAQAAVDNSKDELENLKVELDAKTEEIQAFRQKEMELQQSINDCRKEAADNERTLDHWRTQHDSLKLEEIDDDEDEDEKADHEKHPIKEERVEDSAHRSREDMPSYELHVYTVDELSLFKKRDLAAEVDDLNEKMKNAKPDLSVLKDYRKREEEFLRRATDLENVTGLRDAKKQEYDTLRKQRLDEFMAGFSTISLKLKEMYQMITLGGNAELELVDSMDPFSEGIIFSVMPPKKSWKNISNLSGGEKTLSSLALVFALHVYKPTPLYFMDEIDAALDFRNVSIVANYIKDRTKNAQFIIISLRNDMFEMSHRLIGIYKTANATRSISIDNQPLHAIPLNAAAA
ncbi:uncharacterized protein FIBRA_00914 [Fibroporia radiculosa]|uniref:Structural maintenance of chromosomes protein n=1 Tax=Fibroporia radiculosa TaxID=599839 RepID=J4HSG6_9APHY|nr:uncharacterized protein FIBRA_00914 [Fibroporia radiculosa]CCL98907.1 predicted protein [Fibroporia radiculosa]